MKLLYPLIMKIFKYYLILSISLFLIGGAMVTVFCDCIECQPKLWEERAINRKSKVFPSK